MMTSSHEEAYVWVWLPGHTEPVVSGRLQRRGDLLAFNYGRSYLDRADRVAIYARELPLRSGLVEPGPNLQVAGCIRDGGPDAWGQRVIRHRLTVRSADPDLLDFLLLSDSDRFGALDFQRSATEYEPRTGGGTLEQLLTVAERIDAGEHVPADLADAAMRGTSLGGARPKAAVVDGSKHLIAKFPLSTDPYNVVGAEALAMDLAHRVGLNVAATEVTQVNGRDVLLVERFDRDSLGGRLRTVSALTVLGLSEFPGGHYATYTALTKEIRKQFTNSRETLRELFARIAFNMCVSNTDDHARNHAAFVEDVDGHQQLTLTPAFDLEPRPRTGDSSQQAMAYGDDGARETRLATLVRSAHHYALSEEEARHIVDNMVATVAAEYEAAADAARLSPAERDAFWRRQVLHPSLTYGYDGGAARTIEQLTTTA